MSVYFGDKLLSGSGGVTPDNTVTLTNKELGDLKKNGVCHH